MAPASTGNRTSHNAASASSRTGRAASSSFAKAPTTAFAGITTSRKGDAVTERPTSFWLNDESRALLKRMADETGLSQSALVREAIKTMSDDKQMAEVRSLVRRLER